MGDGRGEADNGLLTVWPLLRSCESCRYRRKDLDEHRNGGELCCICASLAKDAEGTLYVLHIPPLDREPMRVRRDQLSPAPRSLA